jgi:hypothetical protein
MEKAQAAKGVCIKVKKLSEYPSLLYFFLLVT